jgi:uncharacterized protein
MAHLEEVALAVDELEALRLADLDGLYHGDAAERMGVSRATFGRIVETARRKVAEALVRGKALKIGGGEVAWADPRPARPAGAMTSSAPTAARRGATRRRGAAELAGRDDPSRRNSRGAGRVRLRG